MHGIYCSTSLMCFAHLGYSAMPHPCAREFASKSQGNSQNLCHRILDRLLHNVILCEYNRSVLTGLASLTLTFCGIYSFRSTQWEDQTHWLCQFGYVIVYMYTTFRCMTQPHNVTKLLFWWQKLPKYPLPPKSLYTPCNCLKLMMLRTVWAAAWSTRVCPIITLHRVIRSHKLNILFLIL
jgi:hypothetical protein